MADVRATTILPDGNIHPISDTDTLIVGAGAKTSTGDTLITTDTGVQDMRTLTAGDGLTGGGDLSADRTFNVGANVDGSIVVNPNDIQVGILATDAQHGARGGGTQHAVATTSVAGFESAADKTKLDGIASGAAALTSSAPVDVDGAIAAVGVATTAARGDHKHSLPAAVAPADVTKAAAVAGTSNNVARADHKHDISTAAPSTVGTTNAEGSATSLSRSDHVHAHGAQTSGTLHAVAIADPAGVAGFISSANQKKLNDITGTNTGDTTLTGENYLSLTGQALTANAVNLSNSNATGVLAAGRFPALTGDVTTTSGSLATTLVNTAVTAGPYGSAAAVGTFTVDSKGRLTAAADTTIAINASAITSGTLPIVRGGTNSSTTLNNNRVMQSSGGAIIEADSIIANRAIKSNASGIPVASTATATDLDALSGTNTGDQSVGTLTDVSLGTLSAGDLLQYNGVDWSNSPPIAPSSASGVQFFLNDTDVAPDGGMAGLTTTPALEGEVTDTVTVNASTVVIEHYASDDLERTSLDSGVWNFNLWASVDDITNVSNIIVGAKQLVYKTGTVTITGAGTSRTATVSGATPFVAGDANANITLSTLLVTPTQTFEITAFTSSTVVTVKTPSGYANESAVAYSLGYKLFNVTSEELNSTTVGPFTATTVQPAFAISITDRFMAVFWGTTTNTSNTAITLYHSGTAHYSHIDSPLVVLHNALPGLQGGSGTDRYHLTLAEATVVADTSGTNTGDVTLIGEDYLSLTNQAITVNAVDLSGTNVTSTLPVARGGTDITTYVIGDTLYSSAANTLSKLAGNTTTTKKFLRQTGTGAVSTPPVWDTVVAADIPASALTKTDDTNVTLVLGGSASTALLNAASLTLGWSGQLSIGRGGTNSGTALSDNRIMQSSGGAIVEAPSITASRALKSNASGIPVASTATAASLDALSGSNSGDVALAGEDYLSIIGQTITAGAVNLAGTNVTGTLTVPKGGTGQTSFTDGQLLIGNSTGNTLTKATLTQGTNITITNGGGSITVAAPAYGTTAGTICQGNDARLSDDRTASGLRTATTVVVVSAATAPSSGQVLTATSGTAATWQSASALGTLKQTKFVSVAANQTTTSTTFVDLPTLTSTITTTAGTFVDVFFTASPSNTAASGKEVDFQLLVDGTPVTGVGTGTKGTDIPQGCGANHRVTGLSAGSHTFKIQWKTSASTAQIRPVTTILEQAALILYEVA